MRHVSWFVFIALVLVAATGEPANAQRRTTALTVQGTTVTVVWVAVEAGDDANERRQKRIQANPIRLRRLVVDGALELADVPVPSGRYRLRLNAGGSGPVVEVQDTEGNPIAVAAAEPLDGEAPAKEPGVLLEAGTGGTVVMQFPHGGQWWQVVALVTQSEASEGTDSGEGDA